MIKNEDLFEKGLFTDEAKDVLRLAASLEQVSKEMKGILSSSEAVADVETFKSYEKVSKLRNDINTLKTAIKGLQEAEKIRGGVLDDSNELLAKYDKETASLIEGNKKLRKETLSLKKESQDYEKQVRALNRRLEDNDRRLRTLTNTSKALNAVSTQSVTTTVANISAFRRNSEQIGKTSATLERLKKSLKGIDFGKVKVRGFNSDLVRSNKLTQVFRRRLRGINNDARKLPRVFRRISSSIKRMAASMKSSGLGKGFAFLGKGIAGAVAGAGAVAASSLSQARNVSQTFERIVQGLTGQLNRFLGGFSEIMFDIGERIANLTGGTLKRFYDRFTGERITDKDRIEDIIEAVDVITQLGDAITKTTGIKPSGLNLIDPEEYEQFREILEFIEGGGDVSIIDRVLTDTSLSLSDTYFWLLQDFRDTIIGLAPDDISKMADNLLDNLPDSSDIEDMLSVLSKIDVDTSGTMPTSLLEAFDIGDETPKSLIDAQLAVDRLTGSIAKLAQEYELLSEKAGDPTLSLEARAEEGEKAQRKLLELVKQEQELLDARVRLGRTGVLLSLGDDGSLSGLSNDELRDLITRPTSAGGRGGDISQEIADAFLGALTERETTTLESRLRQIFQERREIMSDALEQSLDVQIDNADKIRQINESILTDETRTLSQREKALNKYKEVTEDSYSSQVDSLIKFQKTLSDLIGDTERRTGVDIADAPAPLDRARFDRLLGITDVETLDKEVKALGFSEVITLRILEIIRERQLALRDLENVEFEFDMSKLGITFSNEDIKEQERYLALLEKQTARLEKLQDKLSSTSGEARKDVIEEIRKNIDKVDEEDEDFRVSQIDKEIGQAKETLKVLKANGRDTLEVREEINDLLLEKQRIFLDRQKRLEEESAKERIEIETKVAQKREKLVEASFRVLETLSNKFANDRTRSIDSELGRLEDRQQFLIGLADAGSEQLSENFAFEEKKRAELELQRQRAEEGRARRAFALATFETFTTNLQIELEKQKAAAKNPAINYAGSPTSNALLNTGVATAVLQSLIGALPSFYDGVDDTGSGGNLDAKNGFLAVLHPYERILTREQNSAITKSLGGKVSNDELTRRITTQDALSQKLDRLISVTQSKPTYEGGDWDEMRKSFVETIRRGNNIERKHNRADGIF